MIRAILLLIGIFILLTPTPAQAGRVITWISEVTAEHGGTLGGRGLPELGRDFHSVEPTLDECVDREEVDAETEGRFWETGYLKGPLTEWDAWLRALLTQ